MLAFCVCFLVISIFASKKTYNRYLNPINIFVGINLLSIIFMYGCSVLDHSLSIKVCVMIMLMFIFYIIGIEFGKYKFVIGNRLQKRREKKTDHKRLKTLIFCYSIIFDLFAIYYLILLHQNYGLSNVLTNMSEINMEFQSGEFQVGFASYFTPIGVPLSLLILFYMRNYKKGFLIWIQYALCYIPCISPRRDTLFYMLTMNLLFIATQNKLEVQTLRSVSKRVKRGIIIIGVIIIGIWIMGYTQNLMNKEFTANFSVFGIQVPEYMKDMVIYFSGNYAYLEQLNRMEALDFEFPLISTLRLFYRYIGAILGSSIDTTSVFDLAFYNIGSSIYLRFNTAPILYYAYIEAGVLFPFFFLILGIISRKAYKLVEKHESISSVMIGLLIYDILLFSFRSYNVIFLSYLLSFIYMLIAYFYIEKLEYKEEINYE